MADISGLKRAVGLVILHEANVDSLGGKGGNAAWQAIAAPAAPLLPGSKQGA